MMNMILVAQDGSGQFTAIQDAIDSIPADNSQRVEIYIKDGVYKEKLEIHKPFVSLIGIHQDKVKLTYDDYAKKLLDTGEKMGTFGSYSCIITGESFLAKNITFENNAGKGSVVGQAVAVYVDADKAEFHYCSFLGRQDTLFTAPLPPKPIEGNSFGGPRDDQEKKMGRSYFSHCYLEGDIDFIFGSATSVFENCEIHSLNLGQEVNGYITAASTPEGEKHGYVFLDCMLTSKAAAKTVYLGRPWRDYARTVFIGCWMGDHIKEEGWHNWDKPQAEKTTFYAEYNSFGPGGSNEKRADWAHLLNEEQAQAYSIENIFGSTQGWPTLGCRETPETRIFLAGDSTVEDVRPEQGNKKGWGQMLPPFFTQKAEVINKARGGRSTKSFINEGRLQELLDEIRLGDFLLIQFGHNDQKVEDASRGTEPYGTYQEYLSQYIAGAREKGAIPVLVTPVNRRTFDEEGNLSASLGEYPEAMRNLALEQDVLLIDLWEKSKALYEELGPEETKKFFAWYETPMDTLPDDTHFSAAGAAKIAELVAEGIQELGLGAAQFLIEKHVEKSLAR
jgi:pectin methylesterase-like acyl-CoA thioesterase/lysophospholipase L1-like esterase